MNIQLVDTKVEAMSLHQGVTEEEKLNFAVSTAFSDEKLDSFLIAFEVNVPVKDHGRIFSVKYLAQFSSDTEIKAEDRENPFFNINAPAIAYPFLRAYIANLMLSSGYEPLMLPTINFVKLNKEKKQAEESN